MSEEKSATRQGLIYPEILHLHVLPSSPQSNNLARARDQIENTLPGQRLTQKDELLTWTHNLITWYWSADTLLWQPSVNYNVEAIIKDLPMVMVALSYF